MISKKLVLILSLCVAGSLVPLTASPIDCGAAGTLAVVFNSTNNGVCTVGAYTFTFDVTPNAGTSSGYSGFNSVESNPGSPDGPGNTGLALNQVDISDLLNLNGTGFLLTPTVAMSATPGGNSDFEIQYVLSGAGINSIYAEVDGSVIPNAYDHIAEEYCLGGIHSPPAGTPNCPGESNGPGNQDLLPVTLASGTTASNSASFSAQTSISILKDIDANGGPGTGSGDSASVTGVINQFGPAVVPEPGTYVLSLIGLGLVFLGKRRITNS